MWVCVVSGSQGAGIGEVWARNLVWPWYLFSMSIDRAPTVCQSWAVAGNTKGIWASPLRELPVWLSDLACTSTNVFLCHTSQDREAFRGSEEERQVFPNWSYDQQAFMEEVTLLLRLKTRVHQTFRQTGVPGRGTVWSKADLHPLLKDPRGTWPTSESTHPCGSSSLLCS